MDIKTKYFKAICVPLHIRVQERKVTGSQVHEGARVQENESAMVFTLAHLKFMMN